MTAPTVVRQATARPLEQVDFHLVGGPERFAKLLAAGRIRRRLGFWVLPRVRGNRDGLAALDALLTLPLDLPALVDGRDVDGPVDPGAAAALDQTRTERIKLAGDTGWSAPWRPSRGLT